MEGFTAERAQQALKYDPDMREAREQFNRLKKLQTQKNKVRALVLWLFAQRTATRARRLPQSPRCFLLGFCAFSCIMHRFCF